MKKYKASKMCILENNRGKGNLEQSKEEFVNEYTKDLEIRQCSQGWLLTCGQGQWR